VQLSEKKSLSVYARVEKKTTKESRSLTIPHFDNGKADGDVRSTSRKDARKYQSADLYATMPMSSASRSVEGNPPPI
jgi:hypothetical protein